MMIQIPCTVQDVIEGIVDDVVVVLAADRIQVRRANPACILQLLPERIWDALTVGVAFIASLALEPLGTFPLGPHQATFLSSQSCSNLRFKGFRMMPVWKPSSKRHLTRVRKQGLLSGLSISS